MNGLRYKGRAGCLAQCGSALQRTALRCQGLPSCGVSITHVSPAVQVCPETLRITALDRKR